MAKPKVYLSPSDQVHNAYAYGNTTEAEQCRKIAAACKTALERCGFAVRTNFEDGKSAMYEREAESDAWGADYHVPIHTNAGGGKGTEIYVSKKDERHMKAAQPVYDALRKISPYGSTRGIREGRWHEITHTKALCLYIEIDFHDNKTIAKWLVEETEAIAEAICKGLCEAAGIKYIQPSNIPVKEETKTVKVELNVLRKGDKGEQVKTVQRILRIRGWKDGSGKALEIDGSFGAKTEYAIKAFQKKKGLTVDGVIGEKTWNKLLK